MEAVFLCHVVDEGNVAERIQLVRVEGGFRFVVQYFCSLQHLHSGVILDSNTNWSHVVQI